MANYQSGHEYCQLPGNLWQLPSKETIFKGRKRWRVFLSANIFTHVQNSPPQGAGNPEVLTQTPILEITLNPLIHLTALADNWS